MAVEQRTDLTFPPALKETEIGLLPEDWQVVRLGDLVGAGKLSLKNGFPQGVHNQGGNGVPHLRPFNVSDDGQVALSQIKYVEPPPPDSPWWIRHGDVIFNNTNSEELVGKTAYFDADGEYVLSNHMTIVRVLDAETVDAYWLSGQFHYLWRRGVFGGLCRRHVNQASVSLERMKGLTLALPPVDEQRAIARVLFTIQRAIEATDKVIAAGREGKRSFMRHLFIYGPVPIAEAENVQLKETEIGPVPEHWPTMRFDEFVTLQRGQDLRRDDFRSGTIPVIGATSVIGFHDQANVKGPGVTVVRSGSSVGKALYVGQDFWAHNVVLYAKDFHDNDVKYVYYTLAMLQLTRFRSGVAVPTLNRNAFSNMNVAVPSLSEQRKIARMLSAADRKIEAEEKRRAALRELFRTMLHLLMTGQARVQGYNRLKR